MFFRPGVLTAVGVFVLIANSMGSARGVLGDDLDNITFQGIVKDSSGASLSGATVVVRHLATGVLRSVTSNGDGRYRLVVGEPGVYSLVVTASGFAAEEKNEIEVATGRTVAIDFALAPAGVNEQVTVGASGTPLIDTTRTSSCANVNSITR